MPISNKKLLQSLKLSNYVWPETSFMVSLVCEYLFNLVKTKYGQSVLKSKEKSIFQQGGLVIIYINYHGTPW